MTDLSEEFDEFDEQSQKILMEYKDSFLDFTNLEKQEKDPFEGIRTNKTFQEISNEIAMSTPFSENSFFHSNFSNQQQKDRYSRDIFSLMNKNCIEELFYCHNPNGNNNSGFLIHAKKQKNSEIINFVFSEGIIENEVAYYKVIKEVCGLKITIQSGGNFVIKGGNSTTWKTVPTKYYKSLPFDNTYYFQKAINNDKSVSFEELKQVYEDLLSRADSVMLCRNYLNFDALIKKIQAKLSNNFYNSVNTAVYVKQVNSDGKTIKEDFLQTNSKKPWDVKLNITVKPNGQVEIKHVASNNYMKQYVEKWKKEAKARGLEVDIEALRKQCIQDFESQVTEKSFYQKFLQNTKALLDDNIAGYVEGIQVSQKIAKNVWAEGTINQSTWLSKADEHKKWPQYAQINPLVGGITDGAIDEIVGIPLAVKGVYEIVTDEEKQKSLQKIFTKEGAKQMMEGLAANVQETLKDKDKTEHFAGQTAVSVISMMSGAGIITKTGKIGKVTEEVAEGLVEFASPKVIKVLDDVKKADRLVPEEKLLKEFFEEAGEDFVEETADEVADIALSEGKKISVELWKKLRERGQNFNKKIKELFPNPYSNHEVTIEHPTLKNKDLTPRRFRVDSYTHGSVIVERKATDFDKIQLKTFEGYLQSIKRKYPNGAKIVADDETIKGKLLNGVQKIEVPKSNLNSKRLKEFQDLANSEKYKIEIIFIDE